MDYKQLREQFYKVVEMAFAVPDSKDATEEFKHIDLYNMWERSFAQKVIDFDKMLKQIETIDIVEEACDDSRNNNSSS